MNMLLIVTLLLYPLTGLIGLLGRRNTGFSSAVCAMGAVAAFFTGIVPVVAVLLGHVPLDIQWAWHLPMGSFHLRLDVLSAWFALPMLLIPAICAVYGMGYMRHDRSRAGLGVNGLFFQLLAMGMLLVVMSWDGVLFLMSWEIMSIAAWFLVLFEHENATVRNASWIYLVATHLGTAFLFALFALLGAQSGSFDFSALSGACLSVNAVFLLSIVGFGSKAGFFGMHVWLPDAHPAAPSHVSAVMSAVMIKTGIYGIVRMMTFCSVWSDWWGWLLIVIGAVSGVGGILFALTQNDIKRLLAYSSVENIGIICLGLGLGILGVLHQQMFALLAFAGALLHVWNHALFKSTLFMGAGAVLHATGTRNMELLGGLQKSMRSTSLAFFIAALAICGLPPLNGFVSELMIYLASYQCIVDQTQGQLHMALAGFLIVAALAFIGGLAVMCFVKMFGVVFLGEPRSDAARDAREVDQWMTRSMFIPVGCCLVLGLSGFPLFTYLAKWSVLIAPAGVPHLITAGTGTVAPVFLIVTSVALLFAGLCVLLWLLREHTGYRICHENTWGCGYSGDVPRVQYTASSFVQPLSQSFHSLLRTKTKHPLLKGSFPVTSFFSSETKDRCMQGFFVPLFSSLSRLFSRLRIIQHGHVHLYILYIVAALLGILIWSLLCDF
ncbi:MAG: hydrogenase [Spartobacteria bacterium]|nr:hydrogenase [Spartobacteria bacterium]